jgi:hypothetical protein
LDVPFFHRNADLRLPFRYKLWHLLAKQLSVSVIEHAFLSIPSVFWPHEELQSACCAREHLCGLIVLDNGKAIAPALDEVRFAANNLSLRLALLLLKFLLLPPDPGEPTNDS